MAHFAKIGPNGIVESVLVIPDEQEHRGNDYLSVDLNLGGTWVQTSYNTRAGLHREGGMPLRKNYAGIGYTYDSVRDAFIPPSPYASWVLNEDTCLWNPPIPLPRDGKRYVWNESIVNWTAHPENATGPYAWSELTYSWVFKPQDGKQYRWDKTTYSWVEVIPKT